MERPTGLLEQPTAVRFTVKVEFLDGKELTVEAEGPIQVQHPAVVLIPTKRGGHVGLPLAALRRWEVVGGGIAVPLGLQ